MELKNNYPLSWMEEEMFRYTKTAREANPLHFSWLQYINSLGLTNMGKCKRRKHFNQIEKDRQKRINIFNHAEYTQTSLSDLVNTSFISPTLEEMSYADEYTIEEYYGGDHKNLIWQGFLIRRETCRNLVMKGNVI